MINLILADSAIELSPVKGRRNRAELLDSSYHYRMMRDMPDGDRRGRPDITHFCLLEALGSPLNLGGSLCTMVHTREDKVITIDASTRLPRNYERFKGLLAALLSEGGQELLSVRDCTLHSLIGSLGGRVFAFSANGRLLRLHGAFDAELAGTGSGTGNITLVVGGFPKGHLSGFDTLYSIYPKSLDAWVVVSRLLAECERTLGIL